MKELQQASVVLVLAESLRRCGSWTGETHVQKTAYCLQELLRVPLGFKFILYKHGPYSFDLNDALTGMRVEDYLEMEPRYPYGPSFKPGVSADILRRLFKISLRRYEPHIAFISAQLGSRDVKGLERLATALWVTRESSGSPRERARRLHQLKPHVTIPEALVAVQEMDHIIRLAESSDLVLAA